MPTTAATSAGPRRRLSADRRRASILAAGVRVFAAAGFDGARVSRIAREADINVSVIYDHFGSKAELHAAAIAALGGELIEYQRARVASIAPGYMRLREAHASFFAWAQEHPDAVRLLFRDVGGPPDVVEAHRAFQARASLAIAGYLVGRPGADIDALDPQLAIVAEFLKGGTNAVAAWWTDHPDVTREQIVDRLTELTWSGLAAMGAHGALAPG